MTTRAAAKRTRFGATKYVPPLSASTVPGHAAVGGSGALVGQGGKRDLLEPQWLAIGCAVALVSSALPTR